MQQIQRNQSHEINWVSNNEYRAADPIANLNQAKRDLASAKKSRLMGSNSTKYNNVSAGIDSVLGALNTAFTDDMQGAERVHRGYGQLLHACKVYNSKSIDSEGNATARKAFFSKGQHRQDLVSRIETMAKDDYAKLNTYFDRMPGLPPQERAKNAQEALQMARTASFKLKGTWGGQKHLGGAISDLAVINEGDFEGTNVSGLFKKEEVYTVESSRQTVMHLLPDLAKKLSLKKEYYDLLFKAVNAAPDDDSTAPNFLAENVKKDPAVAQAFNTSVEFHEFYTTLADACYSRDTMRDYMNNNIKSDALNTGDTVNLSKLNVASSRIANLLGQGHLIAQSELATMEDSNGTKINGILMQKAEGKSGTDAALEEREKSFRAGGEQAVKDLKKTLTPLFMKSLADLQVLDNIFGQVDRHSGNYMVQQKDGKFTGLTAIDNDFAFGQTKIGEDSTTYYDRGDDYSTQEGIRKKRRKEDEARRNGTITKAEKNQHLRYATDFAGNMTIPHMSEGLANAIMQLTKSQLDYALTDVLSATQIKSVWARVQQLKTAIAQERKNPNSKRILKNDEDWNEQALQDFMNGPDNYVSNFVGSLTDAEKARNDVRDADQIKENTDIMKKIFDRINADYKFDTPQSIVDFLTENTLTHQGDRTYMLQSGKLASIMESGKLFDFFAQRALSRTGFITGNFIIFLKKHPKYAEGILSLS